MLYQEVTGHYKQLFNLFRMMFFIYFTSLKAIKRRKAINSENEKTIVDCNSNFTSLFGGAKYPSLNVISI